jgi:hypothetical protein
MGLLDFLLGSDPDPEPLDQHLRVVWSRPEDDHRGFRDMEAMLRRLQRVLLDPEAYDDDDALRLVAVIWAGNTGVNGVLVVTGSRVVQLDRKGKVVKSLDINEIARTQIFTGRDGMLIEIRTAQALQYEHDSVEAWRRGIDVSVATLRIAQQVCAYIDEASPLIKS